jgi:hypothetical protein
MIKWHYYAAKLDVNLHLYKGKDEKKQEYDSYLTSFWVKIQWLMRDILAMKGNK